MIRLTARIKIIHSKTEVYGSPPIQSQARRKGMHNAASLEIVVILRNINIK